MSERRSALERDGALAVVTIRLAAAQPYTAELGAGSSEAIGELERDRARGRSCSAPRAGWSAAASTSSCSPPSRTPSGGRGLFDELVDLARRVDRLPCPTVFAAHALCLTWAFELALACDLILAAQSASFGLVERVVGLTPAMGGTQRLAERAGTGRAREFVMTGARYDAETLERWNVVNRVLPDEGFDAAAREFAAELADRPDARPRGDQAGDPRLPRGRRRARQRAGRATVAGALFDTEDLQRRCARSSTRVPARRRFAGR